MQRRRCKPRYATPCNEAASTAARIGGRQRHQSNANRNTRRNARLGCALRTTGVDCRLRQSAQGGSQCNGANVSRNT